MRKLILASASVAALAIGSSGAVFAADGRSTPNLGADMPTKSGTSQHGTNAGATVPAPYGVTTNEQGGVNLPSSEIKRAQDKLRDQGLYHGRIDGILGPETKQALQQFQQKNGLSVTATLDQQTMDKLVDTGAGHGSTMPPSPNQGIGPAAHPHPTAPGANGLGGHSAPKQ